MTLDDFKTYIFLKCSELNNRDISDLSLIPLRKLYVEYKNIFNHFNLYVPCLSTFSHIKSTLDVVNT